MDLLAGLVPGEGLDIVREQLRRLTEQGQTKLGLTSVVALAVALWSANSGMKAMFEAMNVAYDEEEKRGFVRLTAMTLGFTLATIVDDPGADRARASCCLSILQFIGLGAACSVGVAHRRHRPRRPA